MISALPPGRPALTEIVGKSTSGRGATGSTSYATAPARAIATVSSVVATGRRMNGSERFMRFGRSAFGLLRLGRKAVRQIVEKDVDNGRGVKRERLTQQQSAH